MSKEEILRQSLHYDDSIPDYEFKSEFAIELSAMDEYAKQEAKDFFIWYVMKVNNFIYYHKEIKPLTTSKEIEDKIAEFEGQTIERLYELYLESKNKQQ